MRQDDPQARCDQQGEMRVCSQQGLPLTLVCPPSILLPWIVKLSS